MGFFSSFAKGLLPQTLRDVLTTSPYTGPDPDPVQLAKEAFDRYGHNPEYPWTNPHTGKPALPDQFGYIGWLPNELAIESLKLIENLSDEQKREIGFR
jgi:hypothetical protein